MNPNKLAPVSVFLKLPETIENPNQLAHLLIGLNFHSCLQSYARLQEFRAATAYKSGK